MGRKRLKTIAEQHIQMSDTIAGSCRKRPVAPFICPATIQGNARARQHLMKNVVTYHVRLSLSWLKSRKEIGERWKALPSDEKKRFAEMAKASAEEHAKVVPCAPKSKKV
ncbi:unnamed protein product [Camellia sinensis]